MNLANNLSCIVVKKHRREFVLLSEWVVNFFMENFDLMMKLYCSEHCAMRTWYYWQEKDEVYVTIETFAKIVVLFQSFDERAPRDWKKFSKRDFSKQEKRDE